MSDTTKLFDLAQLAEASYANLVGGNNVLLAELQNTSFGMHFSSTQATEFVTHWRVVDHIPDTNSGFSATLFESLDHPGQFTFAIRGSTSPADFSADLGDIFVDGVAYEQVVDMYNYWQRLNTANGQTYTAAVLVPVDNAQVDQYPQSEIIFDRVSNTYKTIEFVNSNTLIDINLRTGTGALSTTPTALDVVGHSLGGHLAMAFTRLFPNLAAEALSVNGLGFNANTDVNDLFAMLGGSAGFNAGNIENVYGSAGWEAAAQNTLLLSQPGGWDGVFIENHGVSTSLGHSTTQMTDSLAVANLFIKLDSSFAAKTPAQVLTTLNALFESASKTPKNSLEALVISLRQLILGEQSPLITTDNREALYSSISTLQSSALFKALESKVTLVSPPTSVSEARTDLGAFLSLFYLTPFALKVEDAGALNLLYAVHQALADKWNDDRNLTAEQITNGEANFSDMWLSDRAAMLSAFTKANVIDKDTITGGNAPDNTDYIDLKTNTTLHVVSDVLGFPSTAPANFITFGSIANNTLTGAEKSDRLYGMGGDDTLNGQAGDDYLEGNEGNDTLNGDDGKDNLLGGNGIDILDGGTGNDQLKGGAGHDIYNFIDQFGTDIITDTDGNGQIIINGQTLNNANLKLDNIYKNDTTGYTFTRLNEGNTIVISKEGDANRIIINNWSETKNLDLGLTGSVPAAPVGNVMDGDFKKKIDDHGTTDTSDDTYILTNNNYTADEAAPNGEADALDLINGTGGIDIIKGLGGSDYLNGKSGIDYIEGGDGGDYIQGGLGKDTIYGGAGDDGIYGSSDEDINQPMKVVSTAPENIFQYPQATGFNWIAGYNDGDVYSNGTPIGWTRPAPRNRLADDEGNVIDGGAGNDFIAAGTGADYVHGGEDKDLIFGMDKDDILFGDGGNDVIYGDGSQQSDTSVVWTLAEEHGDDIIDGGSGDDILYGQGGNDIIFGGTDNDKIWGDDSNAYPGLVGDDFLYGGAGNDEINGDGGNDHLDGGAGNDEIDGGDGNDYIAGGADTDIISGGTGNDHLDGGAGNDMIYGEAGNDVLVGSGGDILQGGEDDDTYYIQGNDQVADLEGHSTIHSASARKTSTATPSAMQSMDLTSESIVAISSDMPATTTLTVNPDDQSLNIALDNGEILSIQAALYGMDATLQFAGGETIDVETLVSTQLTDSVNLFLSSVILGSGATVNHAFGGMGNDQIVGDIANDTLKGYAGNDTLFGGNGNDVMSGGEGNDHTQGDAGNDVIDGGAGVDEVQGGAGDDLLNGGADDDRLFGQEGSDTLDGGSGNDVLVGNAGDDVYLFNLGGGHDVVWEEGDTAGDVLRFGADIATGDIVAYKSGFDLVLSHVNGLDQVTIANWYGSSTYQLKQFEFADGTIWNGVDTGNLGRLRGTAGDDVIDGTSQNETLYGMDGNDTLYGGGGQDTFIGGTGNDGLNGNSGADILIGEAGNDTLIGNGGTDLFVGGMGNDSITGSYGYADTYVFALGDGADVINTRDNSSRDTLRFEADIQSADISAERVGYDLILRHQNGSDSVTLSNWYLPSGNNYQLAKVTFAADGVSWNTATLNAMGTNVDHNYTLNIGDGAKTIEDWGGSDTLTISNTISETNVVISRIGQNLLLAHVNGVDSVTIKDWFTDLNKQIETITFAASGTTLSKEQITQNYLTLTGTSGNDVIYGSDLYGENILGMAGNDTVYGGAGDDQITGGAGNDILYGGSGNDTYYFNQGDGQDTLTDTYGDKIIFGQGLLASLSVSGGGSQDTVYSFGNGSDSLTVKAGATIQVNFTANGTALADTITGSAYNDSIYGLGGNDTIVGGAGKDELYGGDGDDVLDGYALTGTTDAQLYGSDIGDVYVGGKGNDTLNGNTRDDTYYFNLGDGNDVIAEGYYQLNGVWQASYSDKLIFGANITPESIQVSKLGSDLLVSVSASDSITIKNWFSDSRSWVDSFQFADGRTLYGSEVTALALIVHGTSGNDVIAGDVTWANTLYGEAGDDNLSGGNSTDTLHGGLGNDYLSGGAGDDVYYFERGGGRDHVFDASGSDRVSFDASISASDINLSRNGSSLIMSLTGTNDTLEILNYFSESLIFSGYTTSNDLYYRYDDLIVETFTFADGSFLPSTSDIQAMFRNINGAVSDDTLAGTSLANVIYGDAGNDVLLGYGGDDVLYGGVGDDYLDGGAGNSNILYGGEGNDTLVGASNAPSGWSAVGALLNGGAGNDTYVYTSVAALSVFETGGADDKVKLIDGIQLSDISFQKLDANSLSIKIAGKSGIDIYNHFRNSMFAVERLIFADGSSLGLRDIQFSNGGVLNGTAEDSILVDTAGTNDTFNGGDGNDYLSGGMGNDILNGGNGNDRLDGGLGNDTMVGAIGNDVYLVDSLSDVVTELLNEGSDTVNSVINYTLGTNVENLTLTGSAISGTGNELDNVFRGNSIANTFAGGIGNDSYYLGTGDTVTENTNAGTDTVYTDATYTLGTNVENGILTGAASINLTGNAVNNVLTGNAAANILSGGTGSDTLIGGQGNDTYILDVATDVVIENLNEGNDTVQIAYATAAATTLTAGTGQFSNIENITVTGTGSYNLTGDAGDNTLIGNASANVLTGNAGNDVLNGMGGADAMAGGLGNDVYTVDMLTDSVTESLNEGIDLVNIAIATKSGTYTLGNNIENATVTSTVAYNVTGNALDNVIIGNSAANKLTGGAGNDTLDGGVGVDTMVGGAGDDIYIVDATRDVVTEAAGAGNDTVKSAVTYTLGATSNLENIILTGATAINATGNAYANLLMGNTANNVLTDTAGGNDILQGLAGVDTFNDAVGNNLFDGGLGNDLFTAGAGRDIIIGGQGNDTLTTGTGYDVIVFNKGDGQDIINASTGADNTISLGGNFAYSDLSLTKTGNDLIIKMSATDQITLKDWYLGTTNHSVVNLQVIAEAMAGFNLGGSDVLRDNNVENFNFANIVAAFDAAGATANWQLTDSLLTAHLQAGSDSAAIGGDLAYQYGKNGNLSGMGLFNAQSVIDAASFGQAAQALNNPTAWQAETVKLG